MPGTSERAAIRRFRDWLNVRMWGRCAATNFAHRWRTTLDLGYGQELLCLDCRETGWLDEGR